VNVESEILKLDVFKWKMVGMQMEWLLEKSGVVNVVVLENGACVDSPEAFMLPVLLLMRYPLPRSVGRFRREDGRSWLQTMCLQRAVCPPRG